MTSSARGNVVLLSDRSDVIAFCTGALKKCFDVRIVSESDFLFPSGHIRHKSCQALLVDSSMIFRANPAPYFDAEPVRAKENCIVLVPCDAAGATMFYLRRFAFEFVPVPCNPSLLCRKVRENAALNGADGGGRRTGGADGRIPPAVVSAMRRFVGSSPEICRIKRQLFKIAGTDFSVLFQGESGTGKNLLAEITHSLSARASGSLVCVNMATIPENIAESELFGTVAGAFTGAVRRQGYFMQANGSTLFMDEIAELSMPVQAKLLRVLETGRFRSLGSMTEHEVDVRLLCASNADLAELVRNGRFRRDLYYRIADSTFEIPPLRDRGGDIKEIAEDYLARERRSLSAAALEKLENYSWPGNTRQLLKCLRLACAMSSNPVLVPEDILI